MYRKTKTTLSDKTMRLIITKSAIIIFVAFSVLIVIYYTNIQFKCNNHYAHMSATPEVNSMRYIIHRILNKSPIEYIKFVNNNTICFSGIDGSVTVYDLSSYRSRQILKHPRAVRCLQLLEESYLVTSCDDGNFRKWSLKNYNLENEWRINDDQDIVYSMFIISHDNKYLMTISDSLKARYSILDLNLNKIIVKNASDSKEFIMDITNFEDTNALTVGLFGFISVRSLCDGHIIQRHRMNTRFNTPFYKISIRNDEDLAACALFESENVYVIDTSNYNIQDKIITKGNAESVAWDPSGRYLAIGCQINRPFSKARIYIYDSMTKAIVSILRVHDYSVNSLAFSPSGDSLISCGDDSIVNIIDFKSIRTQRFMKQDTK